MLGGTSSARSLDFNGLAFAFARQNQGKTLNAVNQAKLFAIGGCTAAVRRSMRRRRSS